MNDSAFLPRTRRVPDPVTSSSDADLRLHVQRVLAPHYDVGEEIGRGGMGIVYLARDTRLKRQAAVKILPPELAFRGEIRSRFLREAETAAQLSHPNIVPIYSVDEREGLVYFIMGYIDGGNVATRLQERGVLEPEEVRAILREVADALAYAHRQGVVHRDIKPDNILLSRDDNRPMVTDFGIARAISEGSDSRLTATGMAIGTPAYMSPEQAAGEREIDGRSDLYSLGVVGYQMLVGEPPFTASSTPALLVKHLSETPIPVSERRPDVAPDLARAVMLMLEKDPANRFPSAAALVTALDERRVPELAPSAPRRDGMLGLAGRGAVPAPPAPAQPYVPPVPFTPAETQRWYHKPVADFRHKVAPYLFVNGAIILLAILGVVNLTFITGFWTVYMAYQYAQLWAKGYDWRDVFKQPKDRMVFDVAAETIDDARALFDPSKREEVRARERARRARLEGAGFDTNGVLGLPGMHPGATGMGAGGQGSYAGIPVGPDGVPLPPPAGDYDGAVRRAMADRDEVVRLLQSIPKRDRERLGDVVASADALLAAVRSLAQSLTELERNNAPGAADEIEREIERLEAAANPLDTSGSEDRVRRLAFLKRQRRAVLDTDQRTQRDALRLDSCVLALQNIHYDLLRLKTGQQTPQQVTQLAEQAMSLANDVDGLIMADDLARGGGRVTGRGSRV
jgi:hypothetical protein